MRLKLVFITLLHVSISHRYVSTLPLETRNHDTNERRLCFKQPRAVYEKSKEFQSVGKKLRNKRLLKAGLGILLAASIYNVFNAVGHNFTTALRPYSSKQTVSDAYDNWTEEGIVEHYWGDHIHLGHYGEEANYRLSDMKRKDYKQAKEDFILELLKYANISELNAPRTVLDVGCGIGGTCRLMAKKFGDSTKVTGISISPRQIDRATELTDQNEISADRCSFKVMDAVDMQLPKQSYDLVWICESSEHIADKKRLIEEAAKVLKPRGILVVAVWSRKEGDLTSKEEKDLAYLQDQWGHPSFVSIRDFEEMVNSSGQLKVIRSDDWSAYTWPSWYHQIARGLADPLPWMTKPKLYGKNFKDAWCMHKMAQAFRSGLMRYGVIVAVKI